MISANNGAIELKLLQMGDIKFDNISKLNLRTQNVAASEQQSPLA